MDEIDYFDECEAIAMGEHIFECVRAILADQDADTLWQAQRNAYKYTDAGICISFELYDGDHIWSGDERASDKKWISAVRKIGFSSIVEGSDAEVPLQWLDFESIDEETDEPITPADACKAYWKLAQETNDEACALWEEAQIEDDEDEGFSFT